MSGRADRLGAPRARQARRACFAALLALAPWAVAAQVMEIGERGQVTVYDRPSTFDATGATPIDRPTARATAPRRQPSAPLADASFASQLSPDLVEAVAWRESRSRPGVVSRAGAIGEMQLMPATARSLGVDPYDSSQNYQGGATYLARLLRRYDNDLILALAAYNAGPGAVDRWRGVPPYKETRNYVAAVLDRLSQRAPPLAPINSERQQP